MVGSYLVIPATELRTASLAKSERAPALPSLNTLWEVLA